MYIHIPIEMKLYQIVFVIACCCYESKECTQLAVKKCERMRIFQHYGGIKTKIIPVFPCVSTPLTPLSHVVQGLTLKGLALKGQYTQLL